MLEIYIMETASINRKTSIKCLKQSFLSILKCTVKAFETSRLPFLKNHQDFEIETDMDAKVVYSKL